MLRIRYDLLSRLRWNIFSPIDTIEVEDGLDSHGNEHRTPLSSHAIATEPLADPPIYTMRVSSYDLENHPSHHSDDPPMPTPRSPHISLQRPITTMDFVKYVHEFMNTKETQLRAYRKPIAKTRLTNSGKTPEFFFDKAFIILKGSEASISVVVFVEGDLDKTPDMCWAQQRRHAIIDLNARAEALEAQWLSRIPSRIRTNLLYRLCWAVSGTLDEVEVEDGDTCTAFFTHPIATQPLAHLPLSEVQVVSMDILEARGFEMELDTYSYEPLTLGNIIEEPITISGFVMRVHAHLQEHETFITKYRRTMGFGTFYDAFVGGRSALEGKEGPGLFVREVENYVVGGMVVIGARCYLEDEHGVSVDMFFEGQRICAARERDMLLAAQGQGGLG